VSDELYPSGLWVGFYNYQPGDRHRMQLHLTFADGVISGDGNDDIGRFFIKGRYDSQAECHWTKAYVDAHDVFTCGFRQGKGIWGTWDIGTFARGGFHIWPKHAGDSGTLIESDVAAESVDVIATQTSDLPLTPASDD